MNSKHLLGGGLFLAAAVGIVMLSRWSPSRSPQNYVPLPAEVVQKAASEPKGFVEEFSDSKDVRMQTQVTRARMKLAHHTANQNNYIEARKEFLAAAEEHKGTPAMHPEFGTLTDQARYQSIVCLEASGQKTEAAAEYRKFRQERQLSPLVHLCFRRLERIEGKALTADEVLLQSAVSAQEKRIRFETSVCGPKCLEKLLPLFGKPATTYQDLAKLCGTTDSGTTMEGLKEGAEKLNLNPIGLELNAKDFRELAKPAIWMLQDHYVAILQIYGDKALVYDPRWQTEEWKPIPAATDEKFRAIVLAFEVPVTNLVADTATPKKDSSSTKPGAQPGKSSSTVTPAQK